MQQAFREAIVKSYSQGYPFAVYAFPGSFHLTGLFQKGKESYEYSPDDRGFIFAPFSSEEKILFLPLEHCELHSATVDELPRDIAYKVITIDSHQKESHIALVSRAIDQIHSYGLEKIVVSRKQEVSLIKFDLLVLFQALFSYHKSAFRYAWFHPKSGLWVGATPEVLLRISNNKYSTMSLAGTRSAIEKEQNSWTPKEYHEQQVVTDAIANDLEPFSETMRISEVYTSRAGNLEHLRSDIEGKLKPGSGWWDLATTLHPTPAVCGSPRDKALDFILSEEGYNRVYYTGYFGPLAILEGQTDLFVNLRCMRIQDKTATIYTGGGITRDSLPDAEWEETCNKQQTMLKLLAQFL
jgi:isochorismate synthase